MLNRCIYKKRKKRKKTELTNYTGITQVDITMKNDKSKHTNGTLIKLLLKRIPPPKKNNKLVSILHVQPPGNTTCISSGHFPLSLISNVQFSGGSRGGVRGACPPPLIYRPNWGLKSRKKCFGNLSEGRDPPDGVQYLFPRKWWK